MEIRVNLTGGRKVETEVRGQRIVTDQPRESGGEGSAPAPFDLFLASIATCSGYYVLDFCRARNIPVEDIHLVMRAERDPEKKMIGKISIEIRLPAAFPERYRAAAVRVVDLCSVKKHILDPPTFETYATVDGARV
jgi:ribosomal protein S12 methylthiotransferase accessory factor